MHTSCLPLSRLTSGHQPQHDTDTPTRLKATVPLRETLMAQI